MKLLNFILDLFRVKSDSIDDLSVHEYVESTHKRNTPRKHKFVYNYWSDMGTFTFDGYVLRYNWNGYDIPNCLLDNDVFIKFFNTTSQSECNLKGLNFTSDDALEFLIDNELEKPHFDLVDMENGNILFK